ncbi:MAG: hypothetical protein ACRDY2_06900 [Acidimicrobiales bacterium]
MRPQHAPSPDGMPRQRTPRQRWPRGAVAYGAGFALFAMGFVGVAVAVTAGNEAAVIGCIIAVVLGGVSAGIGFNQVFRDDLNLGSGAEEPGDQGDDGGGWWRPPGPGQAPPSSDGAPPEDDEPAWWPAFEHALNQWALEGTRSSTEP